MLSRTEEIEVYLTARWYLYVLFQSLLGNEPNVDQFEAIDTKVVAEAWDEVFKEEAGLPARFLTLLSDKEVSARRKEYTRLYIGPHKLKAPPWESVYVSKKRVLFTPETLEIRNYYRSQGFLPAEYPRVADDHIAIELDFLAKLAKQSLDDVDTSEDVLKASLVFLEEHPLEWLSQYAEDLHTEKANFYPEVVDQLLLFLRKDAKNLHAILGT